MKCPFCGQEMDDLTVEQDDLSPAIVLKNKNTKQVMYQHIDKYLVCSTCGFIAPFFDPSALKQAED